MKSLGRCSVLVVSYLDDTEIERHHEKRVVYEDAHGAFWVNWFGGGKRQVGKTWGGGFRWEIRARSLARNTLDDVLAPSSDARGSMVEAET